MESAHPIHIILTKALKYSGDIDEAHANAISLNELVARWQAIRDRFTTPGVNAAHIRKLVAWVRAGVLGDLLSALELYKPSAPSSPFTTPDDYHNYVSTPREIGI
ncbi:hypothetical protein DL93DRAFT_273588 [Clavulina sp. PMI_390]|nr:hypothetical protein DL93DRAFT_273588 [Clavulina sp. PMI_390]